MNVETMPGSKEDTSIDTDCERIASRQAILSHLNASSKLCMALKSVGKLTHTVWLKVKY
uniref:Uncharacterized protein n=1 Tax=Salarias fasciatus TaxID=181472 RepID=A0A672FE87_SALFA